MASETETRRFLSTLHDERTRDFEVRITDFASRNDNRTQIAVLKEILKDGSVIEDERYAAFYLLATIYRRFEDFSKLDELMDAYADDFSDHATFNHLELLGMLERGDYSRPYALLSSARSDAEHFRRNAGFAHLYADLFATIAESHTVSDEAKLHEHWYQSALDAAELALVLDPAYAKFYCTRGRIHALGNNFGQALRDVQHAIDIEDSTRVDYAMRLQRYYYYKLKFELTHQIVSLTKRVEQLEAQLMADKGAPEPEDLLPDVEPYTGALPYAFLSYAHKDAKRVTHLIAALQERGVRLWFDEGIPVGSSWETEIAYRIDECEAVLFCLTTNTKVSDEVTKEVSLMAGAHKLPVCVDLDDDCLGIAQRYQLEGKQHVVASKYDDEGLVDAICAALPASVR